MGVLDPTTLVLPDVVGAVALHLRADARIRALCYDVAHNVYRVGVQIGPDWVMPKYAVTLRRAGGPVLGGWAGAPIHTQRFDIGCYGPGENVAGRMMNADLMWRTTHPALCPPVSSGVSRAFQIGHTSVMDVQMDGEPIPVLEPDTDWARVHASYLVTYSEAPV